MDEMWTRSMFHSDGYEYIQKVCTRLTLVHTKYCSIQILNTIFVFFTSS